MRECTEVDKKYEWYERAEQDGMSSALAFRAWKGKGKERAGVTPVIQTALRHSALSRRHTH